MEEFRELGLSNWLCKSLKALGVTSPSNIQREAIPHILSPKRPNVFACSRTGSGKTLAFVLPIIETLVRDPRPYYALILSPTRELANQIHEMVRALTANSFAVKSLLIIGGQGADEAQDLWFGKPNLVVATPGRFLDHLTNRNFLDLCGQRAMIRFDMLVLDEADQLISPGFCQQMKDILAFLDSVAASQSVRQHRRQTLLFSATLTTALEQLQKVITSKADEVKPVLIDLLPTIDQVKVELATNPDLDQRYILCPEAIKVVYLVEAILDLRFKQLIVFCATKKEASLIHKVLLSVGFDSPEFNLNPMLLNSDMRQALRFAALDTFRSLRSKVLVTTDLANRGLDLPQVDLVINFSCPKSAVTYVHRVGRTCRKPDFRYEKKSVVTESEMPEEIEDEAKHSNSIKRYREKNPNALHAKVKPVEADSNYGKYLGKAITIITQYDLDLFRSIEDFVGIKMAEQAVDEKGVTTIIKQVAIAIKEAELRIDQETAEAKATPWRGENKAKAAKHKKVNKAKAKQRKRAKMNNKNNSTTSKKTS